MSEHVGLFIDFENLIYGLVDRYGEQGAYELFKTQLVFEVAQRYGVVTHAAAYADWRMKAVNQWQIELYSRGVELVHVLGRGGKNAVDIRMAVDLVESVFIDELITTYLVVSGDRDFLPVIKLLKRKGKRVIALSPSRAMSREMKRICDVTITYERLAQEMGELEQRTETRDLSELLRLVLDITESSGPEGLTGAQLKQLLLQSKGGHFAERDYGCISFGSLLERLADASLQNQEAHAQRTLILHRPSRGDLRVKVERNSTDADRETTPDALDALTNQESAATHMGDRGEVAPHGAAEPAVDQTSQLPAERGAHELQLALSSLRGYQYVRDVHRRRDILSALHSALSDPQGVSWAEAIDVVCDQARVSRSQASKYHAILLQSQAFTPVNDLDDRPVKHRLLKLVDHLVEPHAFIERYERSILHKVVSRRGEVTVDLAAALLGLDPHESLDYLQVLLTSVTEGTDQ